MQTTTALDVRADGESVLDSPSRFETRVEAKQVASPTTCPTTKPAAKPRAKVDVRIARTREERQAAFELVYESYLQAELIEPNDIKLRLTPFHLCDSTEVFIAEADGQIVSTVSLILDGPLGVPMESMYPVEVGKLRTESCGISEIGCLADRRRSPIRALDNLIKLTRMATQYSLMHGAEELLLVSHPRHAKLYKRSMGFHNIGDVKTCPYVRNRPCEALALNLRDREAIPEKIFDRYFGDPIPSEQLRAAPLDRREKDELVKIINDTDPSAAEMVEQLAQLEQDPSTLF